MTNAERTDSPATDECGQCGHPWATHVEPFGCGHDDGDFMCGCHAEADSPATDTERRPEHCPHGHRLDEYRCWEPTAPVCEHTRTDHPAAAVADSPATDPEPARLADAPTLVCDHCGGTHLWGPRACAATENTAGSNPEPVEPQWQVTVTVPAQLDKGVRELLFDVLAEAANRWEETAPDEGKDWDVDVSARTVDDSDADTLRQARQLAKAAREGTSPGSVAALLDLLTEGTP